MWNLPRPGIEHVSSALVGRFLSTAPLQCPCRCWCSCRSVTQLCPNFVTPWTAACQDSLSITNSHSLLKLISIESVMPSNHLILDHPLLLPPSVFPSIRVFSNQSVLRIRWPKYWSFRFSISPYNEHPRTDFLEDGLVGSPCSPRTFKNPLHHHSSKASIIQCSDFIVVQLSHLYMTTEKTKALTRRTFVG